MVYFRKIMCLYYFNMNISQEDIELISEKLMQNNNFIKKLQNCIAKPESMPKIQLDHLIEEISELLERLIHHKLEKEMCFLIQENNQILQRIQGKLKKGHFEDKIIQNKHDASFSDIHQLITEEKKKALEGMNDAQFQRSLSFIETYEEKYSDFAEKINHIQGKMRSMEDKYETGFKSLWNVLSMTEEAFFDHLKEHKQQIKEQEIAMSLTKSQSKEKGESFFNFWK